MKYANPRIFMQEKCNSEAWLNIHVQPVLEPLCMFMGISTILYREQKVGTAWLKHFNWAIIMYMHLTEKS